MAIPETKQCGRCETVKPVTDFRRVSPSRPRLHTFCNECKQDLLRAWRKANPDRPRERDKNAAYQRANREKIKVKHQEWCDENREKRRASNAKYARTPIGRSKKAAATQRRIAKRKGNLSIPYSRQEVFERDEGICGICSCPIDWSLSGRDPMGFTVDHVTPVSIGGTDTIDNVRSAHNRCNAKRGVRGGVLIVRRREVQNA